jgi:pyrimidine-nucleoside phosphorylase
MTPADKKLYALRDVTETVDSIPLIVSSIMSKKLAAGAHNIVLDVKCGSGAFMKDEESAKALATAMIKIGKSFGKNIRALVTNMDVPLGTSVGNRIEVWEAIHVLSGKGEKRLREICISLASNIVSLAQNIDTGSAKDLVEGVIANGAALAKLTEWIKCQGGDTSYITEPQRLLGAKYKTEYKSKASGYISKIQADTVGRASMMLGAGRARLEDTIDFNAGIILKKSYGDYVLEGESIAVLYSDTSSFEQCESALDSAITIESSVPPTQKLIFAEL